MVAVGVVALRGVAVAVVALRGVVVAAVAPRVVSRSRPLRRVVSWSWLAGSSRRAVSQLRLLRGRGGCRRATWCRSRGCCAAWCRGCRTACGVAVTAIAPCGVAVMVGVVVLRGVAVTVGKENGEGAW